MKSNFTMCFMGIIVTLYFNVAQGQVHYPQGQQYPPPGGQYSTGGFLPPMGPMEPFPLESMENFTEAFGEEIKMLTYNLTAYRSYNEEAHRQLTTAKVFDPQDLVDKMAREIEELLKTKVKAVEKLVKAAENARKDHEYRKNLQLEYVNNKKVISQEDMEMMGLNSSSVFDIYYMINLTQDTLFNDVQINPNYSTIHVPTNVYDQAPVILNGIQWSKKLDPIFKQNRKETSDLRWQYYCSADGFLRIYPGVKWPKNNVEESVDMYDCRVRSWYIKAASSPKNMVILVDTSGSMKGRRRIITVKTIQKLLETLSDDDHFNIITYSDKPRYLDNCFSGTLMQANIQNKQRAVKLFKKLEMKDTGELNLALEEAFKLFKSEKKKGQEQCNKAIMVITDGPSETYKEIFETHNWPNKTVRLFSFLVGREVKENRYAKWMACANKGYYTHISTLADVQESVQYYLRVLSRPMGMAHREGGLSRTPKWTPVYTDYTTEVTQNLREGVGLVISVSMPVFDTSNSSATGGRLLGVMGTDIPIQEITNLVPKGKLGANAYTFMYTHHGYVLFHPNMKPMYHKIKGSTSAEKEFRPFFNTIDITEMEYAVDHEELHEFRQKLLSASNRGKIKLKVKVPYDRSVPYDRMNRVEVVTHSYYTASITGTPYKIAIALPSYSSRRSKLTLMVKKFDRVCVNVQNKQRQYEFAPWRYCGNNDILHATGFDRKLKILDLYKCVNGKGNCSDLDSLLYSDLLVHHQMIIRGTIGSHEDYRFSIANKLQTAGSEYSFEPEYKKFYERKGIELLFIATRGGLTDFVAPKENMISPYWMGNMTATIEELYYRQAIMNKEEKRIDYTFSIPLNKEYMEGNNMTILSTIPVYVNRSNIAVAGMMQNFSSFTDIFKKYLFFNKCRGPGCFTCEEYGCHLLDANGYIVYGMEGVSKFLGDTDDLGLMAMLIKEGVFIRETYTDYQSECKETYEEETEEEGASSASLLFSPLKRLFDILLWSAVEFIITLANVGLSGWFYSEKATAAPVNDNPCVFQGLNITIENMQEQYQTFARAIYCNKEPENIHLVPCHMTKRAYHANFTVFRKHRGSVEGMAKGCVPFNCTKSFAAVWIRDTNLILVSSDQNCNCSGVVDEVATMNSDPIVYNETERCELMQEISERVQVETTCIDQNPKEETTECGCRGLLASVPILVLSVALTFWFSR